MRCMIVGIGLMLLVAAAGPVLAPAAEPEAGRKLIVGVFDSRAIVVAFAHSAMFREVDRGLREAYRTAQESGDAERAKELEAKGLSLQDRFHRQGFSTAPVDDILDRVRGRLPGVAEAAGVDLIVSKWRIAWSASDATFVDVTDRLVELFDPEEGVWETIEQMKAVAPLPLYDTDWEAMKEH